MARDSSKHDQTETKAGSKPTAKTRKKATDALSIKSRQGSPLYEQVKTAIRDRIQRGTWPVGHRLPTLRQLSIDLNIAYATVERGVRELVEEGLLEGRKRGGTVVVEPKRARLQTIGILGSMTYKRMMENSRYGLALLNHLQEHIIESQRTVVYNHWEPDQPLTSVFNDLSLIDAMLIFGPDKRGLEQIGDVIARGIPAIYLGVTVNQDIPTIDSANTSDTFRAIRHLQSQGHQRIAFVTHPFFTDSPTKQHRMNGYLQAMKQPGLKADPKLIIDTETDKQAEALLKIDPPPTALFYPSSREFPTFFAQLKGTALEPGVNLALCVYDDNLWNTVSALDIAFIDVEQPIRQITQQAVQNILRMLDDPKFNPGHVQCPSALVSVSANGMRQRIDA